MQNSNNSAKSIQPPWKKVEPQLQMSMTQIFALDKHKKNQQDDEDEIKRQKEIEFRAWVVNHVAACNRALVERVAERKVTELEMEFRVNLVAYNKEKRKRAADQQDQQQQEQMRAFFLNLQQEEKEREQEIVDYNTPTNRYMSGRVDESDDYESDDYESSDDEIEIII